jgi:sulfur dioxygenase
MGFSLTQLQDPASSTFTYFLADNLTKEAVIIDPVLEQVSMIGLAAGVTLPTKIFITVHAVVHLQAERDASFVQTAGLQLTYAINTHCHADHITGTGALKRLIPSVKSVISQASKCTADMHVTPGDKVQLHVVRLHNSICESCMYFAAFLCLKTACGVSQLVLMQLIFGGSSLDVLATPGHTSGCLTYYSPQDDGVAFTGDALLIQGCGRTDFQEGNARYLIIQVVSPMCM